MSHCIPVTVALALLAPAAAAQVPQDLIAVQFGGQAFGLDSRTGASQALGLTGRLGHNAMGRAGRILYATEQVGSPPTATYFLDQIDEITGTAFRSVAISRDVRALAATGNQSIMLGIADAGSNDDLVRVDVLNGTITVIGPTGFGALQGLTLAGGVFYGWDLNAGLVRIDHLTGAATDVSPIFGTGGADIQFLTTMSDGRVLGGRSSLYEIDLARGRPTLLGTGAYTDLRGAEERFGVFYPFGTGCGGVSLTLSGEPRPGFTVTTRSAGNGRLAPGFLLLGFSDRQFAGLPLPLQLDALLGTVNCFLYTSADFTVGASADSSGVMTLPVAIPPFTNGLIFHVQHASLSNAPGGLSFSNGGTVRVRL